MTGPKDTTPPPPAPITSPMLPTDEPVVELPIRKGEAAHTVVACFANLVAAVVAMEKISMAIARALDEQAATPPEAPTT